MRGGKTLPSLKKLICQWVEKPQPDFFRRFAGPVLNWKSVLVRYMEGLTARNRLVYVLAAIPYYIPIDERCLGAHRVAKAMRTFGFLRFWAQF